MASKTITFLLALFAGSNDVESFSPSVHNVAFQTISSKGLFRTVPASTFLKLSAAAPDGDIIELYVGIPPTNSGLTAQMRIKPILEVPSEIIEVRYKLPFGLSVEPKDNLAVCSTDGAGGEKVGDILRFTSMWSLGAPKGDGIISTVANFAGGVGWQCSLFDVMKAAQWSEVVEALTSNVDSRTDEVVLLFERPLSAK